jgi:hypothetical protein
MFHFVGGGKQWEGGSNQYERDERKEGECVRHRLESMAEKPAQVSDFFYFYLVFCLDICGCVCGYGAAGGRWSLTSPTLALSGGRRWWWLRQRPFPGAGD